MVSWKSSIGMIESTFRYSVEPLPNGTDLSTEIKYVVPIPVIGKLAEHIVIRRNTREFELALSNLQELLELEASWPGHGSSI